MTHNENCQYKEARVNPTTDREQRYNSELNSDGEPRIIYYYLLVLFTFNKDAIKERIIDEETIVVKWQ